MFFATDPALRRRAKTPHELAMVNLLLINLAMLAVLLAGRFLPEDSPLAEYRLVGVLIPLAVSLGIVVYTFVRASRSAATEPWFIAAHWQLATRRYHILLLAYLAGAALLGGGWALSLAQRHPGMQELLFIALQRVAVAPMLIALMILIVLESGSLYQASQGGVPDSLIRRFPPPDGLSVAEAVPEEES